MKIFHTVLVILIITTTLFDKDCEAQWVQTNGPYGGTVDCFAVSGTKLFAGSSTGVFMSTNYGTNWIKVNNGLTSYYILSFAVMGTNLFTGTYGGGVFLSTNSGVSWTAVNNGLTGLYIKALTVSGSNIFAGTNEGIFLSTNNGSSWVEANNGLTPRTVTSLAVSGTNIFAGFYNGEVFLSTNNGTSWNDVNIGLTNQVVMTLAVSGANLIAGTSGDGVFLSSNNGTTWTVVNDGLTSLYIRSLTFLGTIVFAGTAEGLYISTNNGTNWNWSSHEISTYPVNALAVSGTYIFAGTLSRGIFLSSNTGNSWVPVNNGLTNKSIDALAVTGTNLFAGTMGDGVFLSTNNGTNWTGVNNGLTYRNASCFAISGIRLFVGTVGGYVFLSTNNGTIWTSVSNGLPTNNTNYSLAVSGTRIFVGTGLGAFLSTNNGTNWTSVNNGLTNNYILSLAVLGTNLFAGTGGGGVFLTTNNGTSWTPVNSGLMNFGVPVLAVSGNNLFAGTNNGLFLSTNNGISWSAINNGLTGSNVLAFAVSGNNLFAGTGNGVFLSTNNGTNWISINQGFNNIPIVTELLIANNYLIAGTYVNSVWKRHLSDFTPLQAPTNLAYDTINNRLVWTLSLSSNVANYLVYKKGSDNIWKSVADSGGMLNSTANFYNIQTSGFNYYKVAAISNSGDTAKSDSIYVNRGYVLKKWNSGIIEPYKIKKHSFSFGNTTDSMWPSSVYSHYNNYSQPPYPRELFMKKRGPFWVTKIHSRAFPDWELFTDIFGNESCYLHHGINPPQNGDVFNKKSVEIWYSSLRNNRFYDGLISDFPGVCVGFSIASALSFAKNVSFYNQFPVMNNVDNVYELNLSGANGNEIRKAINHLGAINFVIPFPEYIPSTSPRVYLRYIVNSLSVISSNESQFNLVFGLVNKKDEDEVVHCVFPYAVEKDLSDNNKFYVYIYDSNRPGNENRKILIDTNTNKCFYEDYNQNKLALYASVDQFLGTQKLPSIDNWVDKKNNSGNISTPLFSSSNNSIFITNPLTSDTIAGFRKSDSALFGDPDNILMPMTDGRFNIPQSYYIPLQNTNILMKDLVNDSSGVFVSYFADTNTFIRYERYDSISPDQTDILRIVNGSLSMYNPDAFNKKINLSSIISNNSTINNQKTFEVNNFGLNYHDSVSSIIVDTSKMKLKNYGLQSSYDLSLIYSDSNTSKYFNHINIIIPENSSHIVSPVWDSVYTQPVQIYVDIGNNGTIDDTLRLINIITNAEEVSLSMPDKYFLAQNYPNPFNPSTIIKYDIKLDGMVRLKVYNILGKEVASLVNEEKRAGRYEVEFNGSNLSSGIYYYRLQAEEYSETRKMLILK